MTSTKEFRNFVLEQIELENITCRPMMGEFLLYFNGVLFGGIYDDKLLIKITKSNQYYNLKTCIPYKNAKPMFVVEDLENFDLLSEIIKITCTDLKEKTAKWNT